MKVGTITETKVEEYRVGLTPLGAAALSRAGHEVFVQRGAGLGSGFSDGQYEAAGATILPTAAGVAATSAAAGRTVAPTASYCPSLKPEPRPAPG